MNNLLKQLNFPFANIIKSICLKFCICLWIKMVYDMYFLDNLLIVTDEVMTELP